MLHGALFPLIFALILATAAAARQPDRTYKENDQCGGSNGFPLGQCQLPQNCGTLESYLATSGIRFSQVPTCGFLNAFDGMMYCCPNRQVPSTRRTTKKPQVSRFTGSHLVTLRYLKPITLDDYVFRCTGVLLSPTHVLATSQCVGQKIVDKPNKVLLGAEDPALYDDSQIELDIKVVTDYKNELVLLELRQPLGEDQLRGNISTATLCDSNDLVSQSNMFAVGYSFNKLKADSCGKFKQQVQRVNLSQCRDVQQQQQRRIPNSAQAPSHLCIQPLAAPTNVGGSSAECSKCLAYTSSVLHVERADGSHCVAGIATPAGNECVEGNGALYFTNILSDAVSDFFNEIIVEQRT